VNDSGRFWICSAQIPGGEFIFNPTEMHHHSKQSWVLANEWRQQGQNYLPYRAFSSALRSLEEKIGNDKVSVRHKKVDALLFDQLKTTFDHGLTFS
jgi:hypothetical protein